MKEISRRNFIVDSALLAGSVILSSSRLASFSKKSSSKQKKESPAYPSYLELEKKGLLSERVEKLYAYYENCTLCPRDCRVNRKEGQTGKCRATARVKISSAFPHFGEEAPLVGQRGSGTIFFSNCGLRCIFCQNYEINIEGEGVEISDRRLAVTMIKVQKMGCHNINLVTPTHYVPSIVRAVQMAIPMGLRIPFVYNTGGYEKPEILKLLDGIVDIYLPDCKYMDPEHAAKYSAEAYNYPHYAKLALKEMYSQVGDLKVNSKRIAVRGLMVRHLIMPNRIAGTEEFLKFVAENLSRTTYLNLMSQYRPEYKAFDYPEIARRLKRSEYLEALKWAKKYGFTRLAS
ncbi:MAG: radical SAM protein [Candidatus Aminicenantales bacterium]